MTPRGLLNSVLPLTLLRQFLRQVYILCTSFFPRPYPHLKGSTTWPLPPLVWHKGEAGSRDISQSGRWEKVTGIQYRLKKDSVCQRGRQKTRMRSESHKCTRVGRSLQHRQQPLQKSVREIWSSYFQSPDIAMSAGHKFKVTGLYFP